MTPTKTPSPPRRTPATGAPSPANVRALGTANVGTIGADPRRHRVRAGHAVKIARAIGSGHARPQERAALDRARVPVRSMDAPTAHAWTA